MVNAHSVRNVVGIIGNVVSFFLFLSPLPTFKTIWQKKAVEEFKPYPYLATIMNCLLWIFYGLPFVHPDSTLVVTINSVGLALEIVYILIFFYFSQRQNRVKIIGLVIAELIVLAIIATATMLLFKTHAARSNWVGYCCVFFGVIMYASPFTIMRNVIKTKSVEYMPFPLSLTGFLNGCIWLAYALLQFDLHILIPNGLGAIFGALQLILYLIFFKSTPKEAEAEAEADGTKPSELQLSGLANMV